MSARTVGEPDRVRPTPAGWPGIVEPGGEVDCQLLRMLDELTGARVGSRYASYRLT